MPPSLSSLLTGLVFGLTLIVAIGAQNAFVLRQGLLRQHVLPVVVVCAASDAVLILAGVGGAGYVVERFPAVLSVVTWAGAAFLVVYGLLALRRAVRPAVLDPTPGSTVRPLGPVLVTCLALTWLNPHVYLDTVVLLGSVAQGSPDRWWFAVGAAAGSVVWFSALGFGARLLRPLFARAVAWRVLDSVVAVTMIGIAVGLVAG